MIADLRAARRAVGWSQSTLASRVGVDPQTIKRLEKGVGSVPTLIKIMAALDYRLSGIGAGATLPEQLRLLRLRRSLPVSEIAARAGLSRATVARLEKGHGSVAALMRLLLALAPGARRRAQERSFWGQGDKEDRDSRFTPAAFMDKIYASFGNVDLDPCGHALSPVVARRRITLAEGGDGLAEDWSGRLAFVNPPFSELLRWLKRAHTQWREGNVATVVCLVPVRTDSAWFHETLSMEADIYFLQGRIRFLNSRGRSQPTPFSVMLVALGAIKEQRERLAALTPGYWLQRRSAQAQVDGSERDDDQAFGVSSRPPPTR